MRILSAVMFLSIAGASLFAQLPPDQPNPIATSSTEQRIDFINREIRKNPGKSNLYTELAIALLRRERETSDKALFDRVQVALDKSFSLAAENLEAQKVETALLIARHEYAHALTLAQEINKQVPDDVMTYGYIADANIALGDYADAEKAAQWMLDLRTHNVPGLLRGAELRQIFGDSEGALQFLNDSYQQTSPDQAEEVAWILTRMAEINLAMGKLEAADGLLQKALASFPDYYRALEVEGCLRTDQRKYGEAADLLHRRNLHFPESESIYAEGEALERSGDRAQAKTLYANFEQIAQSESRHADNDDRDLIFYYLEHKTDASEALRIAQLAISQRHDVWTLDSDAAALFAVRNYAEAQRQIQKALESGVRDADIYYHAAQISAALNNQSAAVRYLKLSLEVNPESSLSDSAREMLAKLAEPEYGVRSK